MATLSTTNSAVFIRTVLTALSQKDFEAMLVMGNRTTRLKAEDGGTIQIPRIAHITPTAITTGAVTESNPTELSVSMSLDQHYGASVNIQDITKMQANMDLAKEYSHELAYGIKRQFDTGLANLYSGLSKIVGVLGQGFDDASFRYGIRLLDDDDVPDNDRSFVCRPVVYEQVRGIDKFVDASKLGTSGNGPVVTGHVGQLYGIPAFKTTQINATGGANNLLFHREAFAYAIQKPLTVEKFARTQFSDPIGASMLWGLVEKRDLAAVVYRT